MKIQALVDLGESSVDFLRSVALWTRTLDASVQIVHSFVPALPASTPDHFRSEIKDSRLKGIRWISTDFG
jgi:hypothetical protein